MMPGSHQNAAKPAKGKGSRSSKPGKAPASITLEPQHWTQEELQQVHTALLNWYDTNHRVLPWRRTPLSKRTLPAPSGPHEAADPAPSDMEPQQFAYWVWVSEVMLQQTQVSTVIPYFTKWVAKWPTVGELAKTDIETVNSMWSGLGYYRRAKYLLDGAQYVMKELGGQFPTTAKELLAIPGVGAYTSAAVASIAFNDRAAVVDGNVIRVLSRMRCLSGDPTKLSATHTAMAQQLLDTQRPGDFNQAVMELGARVCRPQGPDCDNCPVAPSCTAHTQWKAYLSTGGCPDVEDAPRVTNYPGKKESKAKKEQHVAVCVLEVVGGVGASNTESTATAPPADNQQQAPDNSKTAAAAGAKRSRKRQATLFDFVTPQRQQDGAGTDTGTGATDAIAAPLPTTAVPSLPPAHVVSSRIADPAQRHVLLVQRPEDGLLAGLWELPSVVLDTPDTTAPSYTHRKSVANSALRRLLGPQVAVRGVTDADQSDRDEDAQGAIGKSEKISAEVVRRHDAGTYVHVFSHIRQTNYLERLVVYTDDPAAFMKAVCGGAVDRAGVGHGSTRQQGTQQQMAQPDQPSQQAVEVVDLVDDEEGVEEHGTGATSGHAADTNSMAAGDAKRGQANTGRKRPRPQKAGHGSGDGRHDDSSGGEGALPALKWVRGDQLEAGEGVSAGPLKMYCQVVGEEQRGGGKKGGSGGGGSGARAGAQEKRVKQGT